MQNNTRNALRALAAALILMSPPLTGCATTDSGPTPSVEAVPGEAAILMAGYDLAQVGYRSEEFFLSGTASSYRLAANGQDAEVAASAPFVTRIVVTRPIDARRFNGTVIVEWLNVTGGRDVPPDWVIAHRELIRSGYAHVGVSTQIVGIEGGRALGGGGFPLKRANPERYGRLSHPGDDYSFDIFSQAGRVLRGSDAALVLGGLRPQRVIAAGESQSAHFLTTYVNAVDPVARVYDGFLVHSRFGPSAPLQGAVMMGGGSGQPAPFRSDLRVPVLAVMTETDVSDSNLPGYHRARVPDSDHLRAWEIAGSSHFDNYTMLGMRDNGSLSAAELAQGFAPATVSPAGTLNLPGNPGMPHHYVMQAAVAQLDEWVRGGDAPPHAPPLALTAAERPSFALDANGLVQGGVRTPWVDVPTIRLSGVGNSGGAVGFLAGVGEPFDAATLARLYPGGRPDYMRRFEASLDSAISAGFLLQADRQEILDVASASYPAAP